MKKPIHSLTISVVILVFAWLMIERAKADDYQSFYKDDGSLVNVYGAEESGYVIKGSDDGNEIEYFVKPKDDGSPTFIYGDELIVCTSTGCY